MEKGIITKGVGGFYDVLINDKILRCRARGIFRKDNIVPMVGDNVVVSIADRAITEILPRKNQLLRPAVSNIEYFRNRYCAHPSNARLLFSG